MSEDRMTSPTLRLIIPLASLTGIGMLAGDLYLAALPAIATALHTATAAAQGTLAVFMAALAVSQLAWGALADRLGMRRTLLAGMALLCAGSIGCALSDTISLLMAFRVLQGFGAGAATVIVPILMRRQFSDADTIRAMSWVGIFESVVPALSPVLGTAFLTWGGWRMSFWTVALLTLLFIPLIIRIVRDVPGQAGNVRRASYRLLLSQPGFLRHTLVYALTFGTLMTFVASAPHLVHHWMGASPVVFALAQLLGVLGYIAGASFSSRCITRFGAWRLMQTGVLCQGTACAGLLTAGLINWTSATFFIACWCLFCIGLGLRAASTLTQALTVSSRLTSRASGMLMCLTLLFTGAAIAIAGFLLDGGLLPIAILMAGMIVMSALLHKKSALQTS